MRAGVLTFFVALIASLAVACTSAASTEDSPTQTPTATATNVPSTTPSPTVLSSTPTPTAIPSATPVPYSDSSVPTSPVTFTVRVPDNTPDEPIYLRLQTIDDHLEAGHYQMASKGDGLYSVTIYLEDDALVRYKYDRWIGTTCCEDRANKIEGVLDDVPVFYRLFHHTTGIEKISDTVATWHDLRTDYERYTATGRVVDSVTGEPIMDAEVSINGIHTASAFDGSFKVEGLPPGEHRVVTRMVTGHHLPGQTEFTVVDGDVSGIEVQMEPTELVPVRFTVDLPENTPLDVDVQIGGALWQLGARHGIINSPLHPNEEVMPRMERVSPTRAVATVDLPLGTNIKYYYTIGSDLVAEVDELGNNRLFRTFVVGDDRDRLDKVAFWGPERFPVFTLRVTVPVNTTKGAPVFLRMGPSHAMTQVDEFEWVVALGSYPPGSEIQYSFRLGNDLVGGDGTPGLGPNGRRTVIVPDGPAEIPVTVMNWENLTEPTGRDESGRIPIQFYLSVPSTTPSSSDIRLVSEEAELDIAMTQVEDNPSLYGAAAAIDDAGLLSYRYVLESDGSESELKQVVIEYGGQQVSDWIISWDGTPSAQPRDEWMSGIYVMDYWSHPFLEETPATYDRLTAHNGEWVTITSGWDFGRFEPTPTLEPRNLEASAGGIELEDIRAQAAIAREYGLHIFLAPQMNLESLDGWQQMIVTTYDWEWWQAWLDEAEKLWMWNALVAEEIDAEVLQIPGWVFHVFPWKDQIDHGDHAEEFDQRIQEIIGNIREVYSGKLMINGVRHEWEFTALADYIGYTTLDIQDPEMPADATLDEWVAAYEQRFADFLDPEWEFWGKPVLLYQYSVSPQPSDSDPRGHMRQAAATEAIFRAIESRTYIAGAFNWAYQMIDAPLEDGVTPRGRVGEAVQAKWYGALSGSVEEGVAILSSQPGSGSVPMPFDRSVASNQVIWSRKRKAVNFATR